MFQPPHSPELQPAEHLWEFAGEALANTHFKTLDNLDKAVSHRCVEPTGQTGVIRGSTLFHWWPKQRAMK